jgi:CRISPR-associated protein Cmr5
VDILRRRNESQIIAKERVIRFYKGQKNKSEYKSLIKGLGSMIIQNGVYGTTVFLMAKGKEHHNAVVEDLKYYLSKIGLYDGKKDFLTFLEETPKLPIIQDKVLEFVDWYRRYVEIYYQGD